MNLTSLAQGPRGGVEERTCRVANPGGTQMPCVALAQGPLFLRFGGNCVDGHQERSVARARIVDAPWLPPECLRWGNGDSQNGSAVLLGRTVDKPLYG